MVTRFTLQFVRVDNIAQAASVTIQQFIQAGAGAVLCAGRWANANSFHLSTSHPLFGHLSTSLQLIEKQTRFVQHL